MGRYTAVMITALLATPVWLLASLLGTASTDVHRCLGAHGEIVYSGQTCTSLGAEMEPSYTGNQMWTHGCAANADDLLDRVAAAFDTRDVNLLGGLFLWRGFGTRNAYQHMRKLGEMLEHPLADVDLITTRPWNDNPRHYRSLPDLKPSSLAIWLADKTTIAPVEHRFALVERDGCTWLSF